MCTTLDFSSRYVIAAPQISMLSNIVMNFPNLLLLSFRIVFAFPNAYQWVMLNLLRNPFVFVACRAGQKVDQKFGGFRLV
eukprot:24370_5